MTKKEPFVFHEKDEVEKIGGDYLYPGVIASRFHTRSGKARYVVEATGKFYEGMLHIFSATQLTRRP